MLTPAIRRFNQLLAIGATVSLASGCDLYSYEATTLIGSGIDESNHDNCTRELIRHANQNPNATRSVAFNPFNDDTEWTWRVNVTDYAVPNSRDDELMDPHVTNVIYEFSSSDGLNISEALNSTEPGNAFCVYSTRFTETPAKVANMYTDEDTDSTDCTPVLGADCVDAIVNSFQSAGNITYCPTLAPDWYNMDECQSTLGEIRNNSKTQYGPSVNSANYNYAKTKLLSDDGFFGTMSDPHNGTNTTLYDDAATGLHLVVIARGEYSPDTTQALCMRVNTTHLTGENAAPGSARLHTNLVSFVGAAWLLLAMTYYL